MLLFLCVCTSPSVLFFFFFFNDTATTEIYTLSLHDALPIYLRKSLEQRSKQSSERIETRVVRMAHGQTGSRIFYGGRSEEHTSELQSRLHLVCRLLLEKKKNR